ncbi:MAG TPA: hypothetical protein PLU79_16670, partial [Burkholderiaceae bacterium]|nr:hypothetical protein [Burkholderiaceae bacterium]
MASHLSRTHRPGLHATPPAPRHLIALAVAATLLGAHGLAGAQSSATPATGAAEAPAAASLGSVTITGRVP